MNREQVLPESFYDSLSLAYKLDDVLDGFKLEEIHLFSYFSSILFLYDKHPLTDWRYRFNVDEDGYPFSIELHSAIQRHLLNGLYEEQGGFFRLTSRGVTNFDKFKNLETFIFREKYLEAACTTTILIPYSQTLRALLNEPTLQKSKILGGARWLDQEDTYKKFSELSLAVGVPADDLVIPAVTWVNYIVQKEKTLEPREL